MKTGEGKTLVATLAVYLNALSGKGVHLVTVNDYLAKRDRYWMGPVYEFLGLTVGYIQHDMENEEHRKAYACDVTYVTNNEIGFDYLRDNLVKDKENRVLRPFNYAIIDEVDSILVDEARTPLIISGPAEQSTPAGSADRTSSAVASPPGSAPFRRRRPETRLHGIQAPLCASRTGARAESFPPRSCRPTCRSRR